MFTIVPLSSARDFADDDAQRRHAASASGDYGMDVDDGMMMDEDFAGPSRITSPGEAIASSAAVLRGHGTYTDPEVEHVVASLTGIVERVNKLVTVRALKSRYNPEVGDLVVGRISEVGPKRWRVELNARLDGVLMLSSVNLPGGIQRRKLEADELQMRNFFEEGDLLVAEVQSLFADGAPSLHTRSLKFGKLRTGQLTTIPPTLVRRLKSHFFTIPSCNVDVILGMNGFVWVQKHLVQRKEREGEDEKEGFDAEGVYSNVNDSIDTQTRSSISLITNIIQALATRNVPLTDTLLSAAYDYVIENDVGVVDVLRDEDVGDRIVEGLMVSGSF